MGNTKLKYKSKISDELTLSLSISLSHVILSLSTTGGHTIVFGETSCSDEFFCYRVGLKLGPNSQWPYLRVEILGKLELLKLFDSSHTLVSKTPIMMLFDAWLRTWVLWLSNSVLRSKNLGARVV